MGSLVDGGNYDIYLLRPRDIKITLSITVLNEKTQQPLAANVELRIKDQKPLALKTNAAGKEETRVPEIDSYALSASLSGYSPKAEDFRLPRLNNDTTMRVVINLTPIAPPPVAKKLLIKGTVFDKKTQQPIPLTVNIFPKPNPATTSPLPPR